jgi:SNF2 family DNA or RNA helicase
VDPDHTLLIVPVLCLDVISVVFSVWTRMLDLIAIAMKGQNIRFCRLDGSMPRKQRDEAIQRFPEDPSCLVILVSLMAGGVGYVRFLFYASKC